MANKRIIEISTQEAEKNVERLTLEILELKEAVKLENAALRKNKTGVKQVAKAKAEQQRNLKK